MPKFARPDPVAPADAGADAGSTPERTCHEYSNEANARWWTAVEAAPLACDGDMDCTSMDGNTSCTDGCLSTANIAEPARPSLTDTLADIEAEVCAPFHAQGCKVIATPCPAPSPIRWTCQAGTCQQGD